MRKLLILVLLLLPACAGGPRGYYFADQDISNQKFQSEDELFHALELAEQRKTVVDTGKKYLGIPYRYGGQSPKHGFDCSGFTRFVYEKSLGMSLPRTADQMASEGELALPNSLSPGDLLIFDMYGRRDHVGIYIGGGKFFHASPQARKIIVGDLHNEYFSTRFNTARRLLSN